jgi:hypothetical protein
MTAVSEQQDSQSDGGTPQYLCRVSSEGQESLDMSDGIEEQAKNGDGNSVADAIESAELDNLLRNHYVTI